MYVVNCSYDYKTWKNQKTCRYSFDRFDNLQNRWLQEQFCSSVENVKNFLQKVSIIWNFISSSCQEKQRLRKGGQINKDTNVIFAICFVRSLVQTVPH